MFALTRIRTSVARVAISALAISLLSAVGVISGATTAQAATTVFINDTDAPLAFVKANSTNLIGTGTAVGNVVRYNNVGTYGGVAIEAVVTTISLTGSVTNYDNPGSASTAAGAANNWMINTSGGEARFRFEFFRAGTYTGANTGIPVVLQNVKITSIDLDCSSAAGSYQYTDATGFQKYAMMSPTNLAVQTVASTNRVRFIANKTGSRSSVPEDQVMLKYDAVQTIEFSFGNVVAAQTNYFGLVFGGWPNGGVPVEYTNVFNAPPTSTDTTINTSNGAPTTLSTSNFGTYADSDNNPFMSVKLGTVTGGTLEWNNGSAWVTVSSGQVVTVADIEAGKLRFTASGASTIQFWVYDGLDFSTNPYAITGTNSANTQTITFNNPGTKGVGSGTFASGATATSGLTVTLVSLTPGICTVSGLNIVPVAAGTCVIVAKQPGDSTAGYGAAPEVTQEFQIVAGSAPTDTQTITFPQPSDQSVETSTVASNATSLATDNTSLTPTLTSNTPSVCTVTGLTINIVAAGTCTVTASQPGTSTIAPAANVVRSFNVTEVAGGGTVPIAQTWGAAIPTGGSTLKLTGFVDYNAASTTYYFCWTENTPSASAKELVGGSSKSRFCSTPVGSYTSADQVLSADINFDSGNSTSSSNIKRGNTVYFQIVAYHSSSSKVYGKIMQISSSLGYVTTSAASNVLQDSATLNGTAKSRKDSTRYLSFCVRPEYLVYDKVRLFNDTDDKCPTILKSNPASLSNKGSTSSANASAAGLKPATYYYYQLMISSSNTPTLSSTSYGNIVRFKTAAADPVATTLGTTGYTTTSATLTGSILANDNTVTPKFCYSETPTATNGVLTESNCIGGLITASPASVSIGAGAINKIITGLTTGHTYYYQAIGVYNSTSKVYGAIKSFTLGAPTVTTLTATGVKLTSGSSWEAALNGFVNPNAGVSTNYYCIAETNTVSAIGAMTECVTGGGAIALETATAETRNSAGPTSLSKTGLTASTTYYFQAIGRNLTQSPSLDQYGEVLSFITAFAPAVTTNQVTLFGMDTATVPGAITANGALTTGAFCISLSSAATDGVLDTCLLRLATTPATTSGTATSITADAAGLSQATTYYYQAIGENSQGTTYGEILNFTTLAGAPVATTVAATNVANTTATINGRLNPGGASTAAKFCWGTSSSLSSCTLTDTITVISAAAGLTSLSFNLTGLTSGQDYYFRVQGTNSQGTTLGSILSFKAGAPSVQTLPATSVAATSAVVNGNAKANAANITSVKFCVSTTSTIGGSGNLTCDVADQNASTTTIATSVTAATSESTTISSLTTNTIYYFQIVASTGSDTSYGAVLSFTTNAPIGITKSATSIASASAQLNGLVNRVSDTNTTAKFCLADAEELNTDGSLATCIQNVDVPDSQFVSLSADDEVFANASSLTAGNTYFFQIVTTGTNGSSIGQVFAFSTGFAVTFDANGGSGSMNDQVGTTAAALTANTFTKSGSTFTGWATTAGGSVAYADGASYDFTANITLYAVWSAAATTAPTNPPIPKFKSKLTWPNPGAINQGTPLSGSQLNANPEVPSTCVYTPALGTVLAAGTYTLSVVCTPLDTNYEPTSATVILVVKAKAKPKLTWFNPTPITNPTPLGGVQLNAAADVPGKYTYSPAAGTVLAPGKHPLNVKFAPDDKDKYEDIEANVTITVLGKNEKPEAAPTAPAAGPETKTAAVAATKIVLQTSGKLDTITVVKTNQPLGVLISATDWSLRLSSTTQFVEGTLQDNNDRVVIEKGNTVTTSGTGFKPFSQVDIWVYSTPTWLGSVITDAYGNFTTTVPMPKALPAGDHTFQAKGQTPESTVRMADVPITLVNPVESGKPGMLKFEVYFGMNSPVVTTAEKKRIAKMVKLAQSKVAKGAKITVEVSGWVQPNPNPGNIKYLSTNRAKNVATALKALGLKGSYTLKFPGLAKDNIPAARHASVVINWSKSK